MDNIDLIIKDFITLVKADDGKIPTLGDKKQKWNTYNMLNALRVLNLQDEQEKLLKKELGKDWRGQLTVIEYLEFLKDNEWKHFGKDQSKFLHKYFSELKKTDSIKKSDEALLVKHLGENWRKQTSNSNLKKRTVPKDRINFSDYLEALKKNGNVHPTKEKDPKMEAYFRKLKSNRRILEKDFFDKVSDTLGPKWFSQKAGDKIEIITKV